MKGRETVCTAYTEITVPAINRSNRTRLASLHISTTVYGETFAFSSFRIFYIPCMSSFLS